MSEAPEVKNDPTIEELEAQLDAAKTEQLEDELDAQKKQSEEQEAGEAPELGVVKQEEAQAEEQSVLPPAELSPAEVKASLMELNVPEMREYAKSAEIKIPFNIRSKEAIADFIVGILFQPAAVEKVSTPEAPEVAVPEAPEAEVAPVGRLASSAEIIRLLDELEGHGPTVRQFQDLSTKIKALLP